LLRCNYRCQQGHLVHSHANKVLFLSAMPKINDASVTWRGLNSFTMQTFHLL
jgi:hypothetical protein